MTAPRGLVESVAGQTIEDSAGRRAAADFSETAIMEPPFIMLLRAAIRGIIEGDIPIQDLR